MHCVYVNISHYDMQHDLERYCYIIINLDCKNRDLLSTSVGAETKKNTMPFISSRLLRNKSSQGCTAKKEKNVLKLNAQRNNGCYV